MNLFVLLGKAETKLETGDDPYFNEATELVTSILRTEEVLPYKRITLNGALHQLFSGIIVAAYEAETSIDVTSRHTATYHEYGFTTKAVSERVSEAMYGTAFIDEIFQPFIQCSAG